MNASTIWVLRRGFSSSCSHSGGVPAGDESAVFEMSSRASSTCCSVVLVDMLKNVVVLCYCLRDLSLM